MARRVHYVGAMLRSLLVTFALVLAGCAVELPDDEVAAGDDDDLPEAEPPDDDEAPAGPMIDDNVPPADDDRDLGGPRDGMIEACLAHCDAMAIAADCSSTADAEACLASCPDFVEHTVNQCVDLQRVAWECLATAAWSCGGGASPYVEGCEAERIAANDCH